MKTLECPNCHYHREESYFEYADETRSTVACDRCQCVFELASRKVVEPGEKIRFRTCDACGETLVEGSDAYGVVLGEMDYPDYGGFVPEELVPWDRVFHRNCWEELIAFALHHPENPCRKT